METTVDDCKLNGCPIPLERLFSLSSDDLANLVGNQAPGGELEDAKHYHWKVVAIPLEDLRCSNEDEEEPEGGWLASHKAHIQDDMRAVANGSPEYAGRDEWIRDEWIKNTAIHPIFVVQREDGGFRLWDGYRRLAGAFFYGLNVVTAIVGTQNN